MDQIKQRYCTLPIKSVYVHVPFCERKCNYCDFMSFTGEHDDMTAWHDTVLKEMQSWATWVQAENIAVAPLETIYYGGGTPSLLPPEKLALEIEQLKKSFGLAQDCEITVEINPGTVDLEKLKEIKDMGVNRLSIGLQAAQDDILKSLGRIHQVKDFVATVETAAKLGFKHLSADLMFGLPDQTLKDVAESLDLIFQLPIEHLSYYALSIEEGTVFFARYKNHPEALPSEALEREMYHYLMERLREQQFEPYEISNAAKNKAFSRHNSTYWQGKPYLAFGPAASSYVAGVRRQNNPNFKKWQAYFQEEQVLPFGHCVEVEEITYQEAQNEFMILGLRLLEGIDTRLFQDLFGIDLPLHFRQMIEKNCKRGYLEWHDKYHVGLTPLGLDFANQVFMDFL